MNLGRLQISLNHDDPDIVSKGLEEFRQQILVDLEAITDDADPVESKDIITDVREQLHPTTKGEIASNGILSKYINASPELEELFVLWTVPNRDMHPELCINHTLTFAKILQCFCQTSDSQLKGLCETIANRILSNHIKTVLNQLACEHRALILSTLELLVSFCRVSANMSQAVYLKTILPAASTFTKILQNEPAVTNGTSARYLLTVLFILVLESCHSDETTSLEIINDLLPNATVQDNKKANNTGSAVLKKLFQNLQRNSTPVLSLTLNGILYLLKSNVIDQHVHLILDGKVFQNLLSSNNESKNSKSEKLDIDPIIELSIQNEKYSIIHTFFLSLVGCIGTKLAHTRGASHQHSHMVFSSMNSCAAHIIRNLKAESCREHKEIQLHLLANMPSLLSKCMAALPVTSWLPTETPQYFNSLSHLNQLVSTVGIDSKVKHALKNAATSKGTTNRNPFDDVLKSVIPSAFSKKDMTKLLDHENRDLQLLGWSYVSNVLKLICKVISESGVSRSPQIEHLLTSSGLTRVLPDLDFILNVRARILKNIVKSDSLPNASEEAVVKKVLDQKVDDIFEDDFDFNFVSATDQVPLVVKTAAKGSDDGVVDANISVAMSTEAQINRTLHKALESYIILMPSEVAQSKFDMLRLLDDHVSWDTQTSASEAFDLWYSTADKELTATIVRILKRCSSGHCRWFGTVEDATKIFTNVIVAENWMSSTKRNPLLKLMLLASSPSTSSSTHTVEVSQKAHSLFKYILMESGLFLGHGILDYELGVELNSWLKSFLLSRDCDSTAFLIVLDVLLHLSFHWNAELCFQSIEKSSSMKSKFVLSIWKEAHLRTLLSTLDPSTYETMLPISPVLYCALTLVTFDFSVYADSLPKFIQKHISEDLMECNPAGEVEGNSESTFFRKFQAGFLVKLDELLSYVIVSVFISAKNSSVYLDVVEHLLTHRRKSGLQQSETSLVNKELRCLKRLSRANNSNSMIKIVSVEQALKLRDTYNLQSPEYATFFDTSKPKKRKFSKSESECDEKLLFSTLLIFTVCSLNDIVSDSSIREGLFDFITENWGYIALQYIIHNGVNVSAAVVCWIESQFVKSVKEMNVGEATILVKAVSLYRAVNIMFLTCSTITSLEEKTSSPIEVLKALKSLNKTLLRIVTNIIKAPTAVASPLIKSVLCSECMHFLDSFTGSSSFSLICREILTSLIVGQQKLMTAKNHFVSTNVILDLWGTISEILIVYLPNATGVEDSSIKSVTLLAWDVTKFVSSDALKRVCSLSMIKLGQFNAENSLISIESSDLGVTNSHAILHAVDATFDVILSYCDKETLLKLTSYPSQSKMRTLPSTKLYVRLSAHRFCSYLNPSSFIVDEIVPVEDSHLGLETTSSLTNNQCSEMLHNLMSSFLPICISLIQNSFNVLDITKLLSTGWKTSSTSPFAQNYIVAIDFILAASEGSDQPYRELSLIVFKLLKNMITELHSDHLNFVHNFLSVWMHCNDDQQISLFCQSCFSTVSIVYDISHMEMRSSSYIYFWFSSVENLLIYWLDYSLQLLKGSSSAIEGSGKVFEGVGSSHIFIFLDRIVEISGLIIPSSAAIVLLKSLCGNRIAIIGKKLNQVIKYCMKVHFEVLSTIEFLSHILKSINYNSVSSSANKSQTLIRLLLRDETIALSECFHPLTMFDMVTSHSKFVGIISLKGTVKVDSFADERKIAMLKLLLQIDSVVNLVDAHTLDSYRKKYHNLARCLKSEYRGTLSVTDRLIHRMLTLIYRRSFCNDPCTMVMTASIRNSNSVTKEKESMGHSTFGTRLINAISLTTVHTTLADYPIGRSGLVKPFDFEGLNAMLEFNTHQESQLQSLKDVWTNKKNDKESDHGRKRSRSSMSINSVDMQSSHDEESCVESEEIHADTLTFSSDKVYDPSYYIQATFHALKTPNADGNPLEQDMNVSVRQLANSGVLALIIASLCSSCSLLRVYSLACLQRVWELLKLQTPEKDVLFKERQQIHLLLEYIRNAISHPDEQSITTGPVFYLPPSIAIFLAKSSLQLMQPGGELFGKINKFLLSRPFCDPTESPLFDLVVIGGDAELQTAEKLAVLRLVRDGLLTKQDHLNLCRKNAYNRLMLLFPLLCNDHRTGHAVLDILESALRVKEAARYLIERCELIPFIISMLSPQSLIDSFIGQSNRAGVSGDQLGGDNSSLHKKTSKYILRYLSILRRTIGVAFLLTVHGDIPIRSMLSIESAFLSWISNLSVFTVECHNKWLQQLPLDFFRYVTLCMWDITLSLRKLHKEASLRLVDVSFISQLIDVVEIHEKLKVEKSTSLKEASDVLPSLLCLLAFSSEEFLTVSETAVTLKRLYDLCVFSLLPAGDGALSDNLYSVSHALLEPTVRRNNVYCSPVDALFTADNNPRNDVWTHYHSTLTSSSTEPHSTSLPLPCGDKGVILHCCVRILANFTTHIATMEENESLSFARLALVLWSAYSPSFVQSFLVVRSCTLSEELNPYNLITLIESDRLLNEAVEYDAVVILVQCGILFLARLSVLVALCFLKHQSTVLNICELDLSASVIDAFSAAVKYRQDGRIGVDANLAELALKALRIGSMVMSAWDRVDSNQWVAKELTSTATSLLATCKSLSLVSGDNRSPLCNVESLWDGNNMELGDYVGAIQRMSVAGLSVL